MRGQAVAILGALVLIGVAACGSDTTSSPTPQGVVQSPKFGNSGSGKASGDFNGTMTVSDVTCSTVAAQKSLNVVITGTAAGQALQLSLLVKPVQGVGGYNMTKGSGIGGLTITDLTPPGGNWGQGTEFSHVNLNTPNGSNGTFDVWGDRPGASPVELSGAWNCNLVVQY